MDKILEFSKANFEELDQVMPIVERVHGPHHPEFFEVAQAYESIKEKLRKDDKNLDPEFEKLRKATDSYKVPGDVCETYEKIYKVLEELDKIYHQG